VLAVTTTATATAVTAEATVKMTTAAATAKSGGLRQQSTQSVSGRNDGATVTTTTTAIN
jgi:hypothetical protein